MHGREQDARGVLRRRGGDELAIEMHGHDGRAAHAHVMAVDFNTHRGAKRMILTTGAQMLARRSTATFSNIVTRTKSSRCATKLPTSLGTATTLRYLPSAAHARLPTSRLCRRQPNQVARCQRSRRTSRWSSASWPSRRAASAAAGASFSPSKDGGANVEKQSSRWGVSGVFLHEDGSYNFPSNSLPLSQFGCGVAAGVLSDEEADAAHQYLACLLLACPNDTDDTSCHSNGDENSKNNECIAYAGNIGACAPLTQKGQAAIVKLYGNEAAVAACQTFSGALATFCGGAAVTK